MKTLVVLLILSGALVANADVVIYKIVQTNTWTGGGTVIKQKVSGRLVFDPDTVQAKMITQLPQSRYQVDCPSLVVKYMEGVRVLPSGARQRTSEAAFFLKGDGYDSDFHVSNMQMFIRGANSTVLIANERQLLVPKILRGSVQSSYESATAVQYVGQGSLVASYMGNETIAANANSLTVDEVVTAIAQTYQANGWTEVIGDVPCE